jgi:hypothetical protein
MDDSHSKTISALVAIGGLIIGALGFGWGIYTNIQSRTDVQKRAVLEKELAACIELNKNARQMMEAKIQGKPEKAKKAAQSFKAIFEGELMVTGDVSVINAATHFSNCYNAPKCDFMGQFAGNLINACRTSVVGSLDAVLPRISPPTITHVEVK